MRADLKTSYLGLTIKHPIAAAAGPLTGDLDSLRQLDQAGISAVVLPSLFEEQISRDEQRLHSVYEFQTYSTAESLSRQSKLRFTQRPPETRSQAASATAIPFRGAPGDSFPARNATTNESPRAGV